MRTLRAACLFTLLVASGPAEALEEADGKKAFRAGAATADITPRDFPVWVSGGFLASRGHQAQDRLESRAIVLDDGATRIAIAVTDSLMMPRSLLDLTKQDVSRATGIPPKRILIAATHTHSAPSVMGALGTPADAAYARFLQKRIAESIIEADRRLEPARAGWAVVRDYAHNHCRRWILRPDRIGKDPFGGGTVRAMMHPGHQSPDHIGPSGPADPDLALLAITSRDGRPIAALANYAFHYKGAAPVSGDACGRFGAALARLIGAEETEPPFVGILSQGTSGDSMWMDYARPARDPGLDGYTLALAESARRAWEQVSYRESIDLAMAEALLALDRRAPDEDRLRWARSVVERMGDRLPRDRAEVYALEAIHLHENPCVEIKLQAVRIGELGIAAIPNEVYGITGLKLKAQSPLETTCVIELANGAAGYIPPPEQHALGGYTTWPARTAGLEIQAEPKIVESLVKLLKEVAGTKRREHELPSDGYLEVVRASSPDALWRFDEMTGPTACDASGRERHGTYEGQVAFYLPGRARRDLAFEEMTHQRAVQLAGGRVRAALKLTGGDYTLEMWVWNGLPADARSVTGQIYALGPEDGRRADQLAIAGNGRGTLVFSIGEKKLEGRTPLALRAWHHVAVVREGRRVRVHLDGREEPEIDGELEPHLPHDGILLLGAGHDLASGLEGRIDGTAFYERVLPEEEIAAHHRAAGIEAPTK